jgi:predicted enzyme related to lactoylglutathione lyase
VAALIWKGEKTMKWTAAVFILFLVASLGVDAFVRPSPDAPGISGNLVFFYYKDLAGAKKFYEDTLGLPLVLDYGFAVIYRISESSFVGLVDEKKGMHKTTEPKTVTLAFVTDEVDGWFQYLSERGVAIKSPLKDSATINVRGFVALDPEGYFLEFENFLEAPRNAGIRESLKKVRPLYPGAGARPTDQTARPAGLGLRATVFWLYYNDLIPAQKFVEDVFGQTLLVDQGFSKVYPSSNSGFIGLVDQARGLHRFSETKSVNVVFQTPHLESWFERFKSRGIKIKSELGEAEGSLVRAFVALDPAGYFLEFHWFKPDPKNEAILRILQK